MIHVCLIKKITCPEAGQSAGLWPWQVAQSWCRIFGFILGQLQLQVLPSGWPSQAAGDHGRVTFSAQLPLQCPCQPAPSGHDALWRVVGFLNCSTRRCHHGMCSFIHSSSPWPIPYSHLLSAYSPWGTPRSPKVTEWMKHSPCVQAANCLERG